MVLFSCFIADMSKTVCFSDVLLIIIQVTQFVSDYFTCIGFTRQNTANITSVMHIRFMRQFGLTQCTTGANAPQLPLA